jgi:hypothetical protein
LKAKEDKTMRGEPLMRCTLPRGGDIRMSGDDWKVSKLGVLGNEALDSKKWKFFVAEK